MGYMKNTLLAPWLYSLSTDSLTLDVLFRDIPGILFLIICQLQTGHYTYLQKPHDFLQKYKEANQEIFKKYFKMTVIN